MPLTTVTIQTSTTSTPIVTTETMPEVTTIPSFRDSIDEDFGIQDDDSDDTSDEDLDIESDDSDKNEDNEQTDPNINDVTTTTVQSSTQDDIITESVSDDAPATLPQVNTSPRPQKEQLTTVSQFAEESLSTSTETQDDVDSEPATSSSIEETTITADPTDCVFLQKTYKDKEQIPSDDPCQLCFCTSGELVCAVKECPIPAGMENCIPRQAPEGECCPLEYECGK